MEVEFPGFLVLFDLDGVLVVEVVPGISAEKRQLLLLHGDVQAVFNEFAAPVGIVTHRPRREARAILSAAGIDEDRDLLVSYCAEDLLRLAVRHGNVVEIWQSGLKKSHAVLDIARRLEIPPDRICIIDNREAIIGDMESHGVGLRLHVDWSTDTSDRQVVRFDIGHAAATFRDWASQQGPDATIKLHRETIERDLLSLVHLDLSSHGATLFERARPVRRALRDALGLQRSTFR